MRNEIAAKLKRVVFRGDEYEIKSAVGDLEIRAVVDHKEWRRLGGLAPGRKSRLGNRGRHRVSDRYAERHYQLLQIKRSADWDNGAKKRDLTRGASLRSYFMGIPMACG